MLGPITGLVVFASITLYCVWRRDLKNALLSGAVTMLIICLTVRTVGFEAGGPYYIRDVAYVVSITLAVIGVTLHIDARLRRRRRAIKKPVSVEEVAEPVSSHS